MDRKNIVTKPLKKNIVTETLEIKGMTCASCEQRIERKIKSLGGVVDARASYRKSHVNLTFNPDRLSLSVLQREIEGLGYGVILRKQETSKKPDTLQIVGFLVVLFAIYTVLSHHGGLDIFKVFPEAKAGMGYGALFIIGLFTSLHCVAMCGGINISQCAGCKNQRSSLKPSLQYNLGRVFSYTLIGGIAGALGSAFGFSDTAKGFVTLFAGAFMIIMGLNMLNIFPGLRTLNLRMPKIFTRNIQGEKAPNRPLYVGLLNGLMPCGPLQAMQLYALSTGSPTKGALAMLLFSLGTLPLMFGLGALSTVLTKKFSGKMMTASAALVILLGLFMFNNGMALSGVSMPFTANRLTAASESNAAVAEMVDGIQVVTTPLASGRYQPIKVQAGIPVKWIISAEEKAINGCNNRIIVPEYGMKKPLVPGDNIITFTPEESGTVAFSCWMGMIRSSITVYE